MMKARSLAPLLLLLALHLGATAAQERISGSLCDASFAKLRRCSQNLEQLATDNTCCSRLREFRAQGCTCPGCDDTSDDSAVEALTEKGMTWMLELQPLAAACAGDSDDAPAGESALHSVTLEAPQFVQSVTEVEVQGRGKAHVEEISASVASGEEDEEAEEEAILGTWEAVDSQLSTLEANSDSAKFNYLADDAAVPIPSQQQPQPEHATLYEDHDINADDEEEDSSNADSGSDSAEQEGWAGSEANTWGVEAAEEEAVFVSEGVELLRAEVLASSEDFPLELHTGRSAFPSVGSSDSESEERDDSARGQLLKVQPAAGFAAQAEQQEAVGGGQQQVVVSHTRTVTVDLEMEPRSMAEAAEVVQQVLDSATSGSLAASQHGLPSSMPLRPVSRKVSIDIRVDGAHARPLGELLANWLPTAASQSSSAAVAALRAQIAQQLAEQQQQASEHGQSCQCVGMELPYSAEAQPTAMYYYYMRARLALCQFSCQHRLTITVALVIELAICVAWAVCVLLRRVQRAAEEEEEEEEATQFVVASAADPEWHKPLLHNEV